MRSFLRAMHRLEELGALSAVVEAQAANALELYQHLGFAVIDANCGYHHEAGAPK